MLVDTEYIKNLLGITTTDDDETLTQLLKARHVEFSYFESEARTEYYDGTGTNQLFVEYSPITAIDSIYDDYDREFTADTKIDSDNISFNDEQGIIYLDAGVFCKYHQNIKIIYTAGYTLANVPHDLKLAIAQFVMADYLELKGGVNAFEGESTTYKPKNLRDQAEQIINKYRFLR